MREQLFLVLVVTSFFVFLSTEKNRTYLIQKLFHSLSLSLFLSFMLLTTTIVLTFTSTALSNRGSPSAHFSSARSFQWSIFVWVTNEQSSKWIQRSENKVNLYGVERLRWDLQNEISINRKFGLLVMESGFCPPARSRVIMMPSFGRAPVMWMSNVDEIVGWRGWVRMTWGGWLYLLRWYSMERWVK